MLFPPKVTHPASFIFTGGTLKRSGEDEKEAQPLFFSNTNARRKRARHKKAGPQLDRLEKEISLRSCR